MFHANNVCTDGAVKLIHYSDIVYRRLYRSKIAWQKVLVVLNGTFIFW